MRRLKYKKRSKYKATLYDSSLEKEEEEYSEEEYDDDDVYSGDEGDEEGMTMDIDEEDNAQDGEDSGAGWDSIQHTTQSV